MMNNNTKMSKYSKNTQEMEFSLSFGMQLYNPLSPSLLNKLNKENAVNECLEVGQHKSKHRQIKKKK